MNKFILFPLFGLIIFTSAFAQAPQSFNYQAVVRNDNGSFVMNQDISVQVRIREGSLNGDIKLTETHNPTTDDLGLFSLEIGNGTLVSGNMNTVNWGENAHFIQIGVDLNNGTTYNDLGTFQILSVPYALYGKDEDSDPDNEKITGISINGSDLTITEPGNSRTINLGGLSGNSVWTEDSPTTISYTGQKVRLNNSNSGNKLVELELDSGNDGAVNVYNDAEDLVTILGVDADGAGMLSLYPPNNVSDKIAEITSYGGQFTNDGVIRVGVGGSVVAQIGSEDSGLIETFQTDGSPLVLLSESVNESGIIEMYNTDGNNLVRLTSMLNNANRGAISVYDENGEDRAGIEIDDDNSANVYGDMKSFIMNHPNNPNQQIQYVSIEGPEAAAYERGTSQLINGEAFIPFSKTFDLVINPSTMTVMLTPLSADSKGLAVIEKAENGFRVKELMEGKGSYQFDWEVKGIRQGYENFNPIREKQSRVRAKDSKRANQKNFSMSKSQSNQ